MSHASLLRVALLSTSILGFAAQPKFAQNAGGETSSVPETSLRVLPAPPVSQEVPNLAEAPAPSVMPAFGAPPVQPNSPYGALEEIQACPYKQIRAAYDEAVSGKDALDTLAVEREILILCEERNALVAKLLEGENTLRDLLAPSTSSTTAAAPQDPSSNNTSNEEDPLERLTQGDAPTSATQTTIAAAQVANGSVGAVAPTADTGVAQCEPVFATRFIARGSAETGAQALAGITDTISKTELLVRTGDSLPGGYVVEGISVEEVRIGRGGITLSLPRLSQPQTAEGFYAETSPSASDTQSGAEPFPAGVNQ